MLFFVGTYTRLGGPGIALCRLDGQGLRLLSARAELANPTYVILSRDGRSLFAAGTDPDTGEGLAASYAVEGEGLRLTGRAHTGGKAACHLTLDPAERHLYVTNYLSGSVAAFPVESGRIGPRQQLLRHEGSGPNPGRQEGPHTHQARFRPGGSELFVCDLGIDAVVVYAQDPETGALSWQASIPVESGAGPRHLIFSSPDRFYLACELDSTVRVYERDHQGFACVQALSTLPEGWAGENTAAAIRLFQGRVYVSNRGHDSVAAFTVQTDGRLLPERLIPVPGRTPRDFRLLGPEAMLVACQDEGGLLWMREGQAAGRLDIPGAVCVSEGF